MKQEKVVRYLDMAAAQDAGDGKGLMQMKTDLAEHQKRCEAKQGNCPYEKQLKNKIDTLEKEDDADKLTTPNQSERGKEEGVSIEKGKSVIGGQENAISLFQDIDNMPKGYESLTQCVKVMKDELAKQGLNAMRGGLTDDGLLTLQDQYDIWHSMDAGEQKRIVGSYSGGGQKTSGWNANRGWKEMEAKMPKWSSDDVSKSNPSHQKTELERITEARNEYDKNPTRENKDKLGYEGRNIWNWFDKK